MSHEPIRAGIGEPRHADRVDLETGSARYSFSDLPTTEKQLGVDRTLPSVRWAGFCAVLCTITHVFRRFSRLFESCVADCPDCRA